MEYNYFNNGRNREDESTMDNRSIYSVMSKTAMKMTLAEPIDDILAAVILEKIYTDPDANDDMWKQWREQ
ncbi:MAG: hypothetical protein LBM09_01405 [Candidatus Nomurabacteria bacterium]|jgi:hypothetical protein|nr:hypothetical protein [Candidatus Nomurabacteria bacterium]